MGKKACVEHVSFFSFCFIHMLIPRHKEESPWQLSLWCVCWKCASDSQDLVFSLTISEWAENCVPGLGAKLFFDHMLRSKTLLVKTRHWFHFRILTGYHGLTVLLHEFPVAIDNDTTISFRTGQLGDIAIRILWVDLPWKHTLVVRFHAFLETRNADTIATFLWLEEPEVQQMVKIGRRGVNWCQQQWDGSISKTKIQLNFCLNEKFKHSPSCLKKKKTETFNGKETCSEKAWSFATFSSNPLLYHPFGV